MIVRFYPNALAIECSDDALAKHLSTACENCGLSLEDNGTGLNDQLWHPGSEMDDPEVEETMWTLLLLVQQQTRAWCRDHSELLELTIECFDFHRFSDQTHEQARSSR